MPAVWVNLWQSVGSFSFSISLDHEAVFLAALQRDLHKAELLIASLQGARLDSASHPFFCEKKKKRNEILEIAAKGFLPTLDLPCGVCQTKEDPLIWSQQEPSTILGTHKFEQEKSVPPPQRPRRVGWPHKVDEHVCDWKCLITNIYFLQHCNHLIIYIYILSILCKKGTYDDDFFNALTMRCAFHQAYQTIWVLQCITFFFLTLLYLHLHHGLSKSPWELAQGKLFLITKHLRWEGFKNSEKNPTADNSASLNRS